ncbi:integrase core domain-containing protein [Ruegeria pomeroyi]|uniref:Transposase, truncation n=2 Tax=Ruegeria pomeroyi TaxID=89184 RepID=Q5LWQ7_RUEPO|nr:transposase, truncation [Ruegeria pomeroyi DSS-3]NVK99068.1 transposase [Ruegeria pomeroyi]NVL03927.1 transposase [Ruegeria pomeroyi]QWV10733.1 integrase core domain-containing protein [Ruegeria pomeroyi]
MQISKRPRWRWQRCGATRPCRRHLDNIVIERLWRSLKQEAIYLEEITDSFQVRRISKGWMAFYNTRPHSALDRQTPDDAYRPGLNERNAA